MEVTGALCHPNFVSGRTSVLPVLLIQFRRSQVAKVPSSAPVAKRYWTAEFHDRTLMSHACSVCCRAGFSPGKRVSQMATVPSTEADAKTVASAGLQWMSSTEPAWVELNAV